MYLPHKYTIVQMMHVSGHKTQKTFMDYIKLSSDELKIGEYQLYQTNMSQIPSKITAFYLFINFYQLLTKLAKKI